MSLIGERVSQEGTAAESDAVDVQFMKCSVQERSFCSDLSPWYITKTHLPASSTVFPVN